MTEGKTSEEGLFGRKRETEKLLREKVLILKEVKPLNSGKAESVKSRTPK